MFYNSNTSKLQCNKSLKRYISEKEFLEAEERRLKDSLVNHSLNTKSEARFKKIDNTAEDTHITAYGSDYDTSIDTTEIITEEEQDYLDLIESIQKKDVKPYTGEVTSSLVVFGSVLAKTALQADMEELRDDVRKGYITDRQYYKRLEELNRGE